MLRQGGRRHRQVLQPCTHTQRSGAVFRIRIRSGTEINVSDPESNLEVLLAEAGRPLHWGAAGTEQVLNGSGFGIPAPHPGGQK